MARLKIIGPQGSPCWAPKEEEIKLSHITSISQVQNFLSEILLLMNENIHNRELLSNKSPRLRLVLLFANNWSSDRIIYGCLNSLAKKFSILKFYTRGIRLIISSIE
jgi:hypothetical protein